MAITVEDGTGLATADAYVSVAFVDAYHLKYGNPLSWANASTADKEEAIVIATQYLDYTYGQKWFGRRVEGLQALDFPRTGIEDRDGFAVLSTAVPTATENATSEMALRHIDGDILGPDLSAETNIKSERVVVGPIEEEIEYIGDKDTTKSFPRVSRMLSAAGLIAGPGVITRS